MVTRNIVVGHYSASDTEWSEEGDNFFAQVGEFPPVRGKHLHATILTAADDAGMNLTLLFDTSLEPVLRDSRSKRAERSDAWQETTS